MGVSPLTPLGHQAGSGQPVPLCSQGLRCRRPSSDLFPTRRLSTKVFPPSPYPPSFQPYLPHVFQASPTPYPIVFRPLPTTPYPLSFTTSCFHEFGRPNPGLSQIQDVSRESRRMSREKKRRL